MLLVMICNFFINLLSLMYIHFILICHRLSKISELTIRLTFCRIFCMSLQHTAHVPIFIYKSISPCSVASFCVQWNHTDAYLVCVCVYIVYVLGALSS
jgi:hypothetical protein